MPQHLIESLFPLIRKTGRELRGITWIGNLPSPHFELLRLAQRIMLNHLTKMQRQHDS